MQDWDGQVDHIHLVRVRHLTPQPQLSAGQLLAENVRHIRWWKLDELVASRATFAPRALPALVASLYSGPMPQTPVAITGF